MNAFGGSAGIPATGGNGTGGRAAGSGGALGGGGRGLAGDGAGGSGTAGSGTAGSAGAPSNCITTLMPQQQSGELGKGAICYDITANMAGWTIANLGTRTLTVNGMPLAKPAPAVPPAVDGHRVFQFGTADGSTDQPSYTTWSYW
jgi:hypothetical protein